MAEPTAGEWGAAQTMLVMFLLGKHLNKEPDPSAAGKNLAELLLRTCATTPGPGTREALESIVKDAVRLGKKS